MNLSLKNIFAAMAILSHSPIVTADVTPETTCAGVSDSTVILTPSNSKVNDPFMHEYFGATFDGPNRYRPGTFMGAYPKCMDEEVPSNEPSRPPQVSMTDEPSENPTESPVIAPTTDAPSENPTESPVIIPPPPTPPNTPTTPTDLVGCETAYVYCAPDDEEAGGAISTCFSDFGQPANRWGWSIDLDSVDPSRTDIVCDIYAAAGQCNLNSGTKVGSAYIGYDYYDIQMLSGMGASEVHLYTGPCPLNDDGEYFDNGQECDSGSYNVAANGKFPAKYETSPILKPMFSFMDGEPYTETNTWADARDVGYSLYPSGLPSTMEQDARKLPNVEYVNRYLIIHAKVCPCTDNDTECNGQDTRRRRHRKQRAI